MTALLINRKLITMKKILIFSALILSAFFFVQCKKSAPVVTFNPSQTNGGKIVYVDLDTLYTKYQMYIDSKQQLEDDYKKAESNIGGKFEAFQKKAADFQRKVMEIQQRAQDIAPVELKKLEADFGEQQKRLAEEEAALNKQRDAALGGLDKKIQDLQAQIKTKIDQYLEKIAAERGYDYVIVKSSLQGGILYGNKNLDITEETVRALNESYKK